MSRNLHLPSLAVLAAALSIGCPDFPESGRWACSTEGDCQAGEVCGGDGTCVARPNTGACSTDQDCGANARCNNGSCVSTGTYPACSSSTDCPSGETCVMGFCAPIGQECRTDIQCGGERVCVAGTCCTRNCESSWTCDPQGAGLGDGCGGWCQAGCPFPEVCGPLGCCLVEGRPCASGRCCSGECKDLAGTGTLVCVN